MVITIVLCIAWLIFIVALVLKIYRQSTVQDTLYLMRLGREHINIVGTAYQKAIANGDIQMIELCYTELHKLVDQYNKTFEKHGGYCDIRQWIKEE